MGQLRTLRARLMLQRFCNVWARAALAVGGVLVIAVALQRAMNRGTTFPMFWAGLAVLTTTVGAAAIAFTRRHSWNDVASVVDRRASTRDRFATALSFAKEPRPENENAPLKTLAAAECQEFLANRRFIEFFPWRVPREAGWLLVPVVMLALLQWDAHEIVDETLHNDFEFFYLVIRNSDDRVIGIQPFFLVRQDFFATAHPALQRFARIVRRVFPRFFRPKILMAGCAAGEGHPGAEDEDSQKRLLRAAGQILPKVARHRGITPVVWKDFPS